MTKLHDEFPSKDIYFTECSGSQSGDPASPHYRDLFPLWAAGSYVPLRYSRAAVDADAETVIALTPAP